MKNFFDNQRIISVIWERKFHFIIVAFIALVLAAVFSSPWFIQPKFKSTIRIYPTNLWTMSNESETEQMLEIVNSRDIKLKMFEAFRLDTVYGINSDDPKYMTYMLDLYNTNVGASKTEFETVEIKVLDANPQRAADMCDSIVHFYNLKVKELHSLKAWEMVEISGKWLKEKNHELDSIMEILNKQREEYGILGYRYQAEEVTRGYMEALANNRGNTNDTKTIKKLYDNLQKAGGQNYLLEKKVDLLINKVDSLQYEHEAMLVEAQKQITYSHVVEYPIPADKKAYPVRWLIALASVFFCCICGFAGFFSS